MQFPGESADRLATEQAFHDHAFSANTRREVERFYSVTGASDEFYRRELLRSAGGRDVLECGCGPMSHAIPLARAGARVTAIDLSPVAIEQAMENARAQGVDDHMTFRVMNAEALDFPDGSFDVVCGHSIIHHLDLPSIYAEVRRVLRPSGVAIFLEPLGHNAFINFYRRRTPHLRTPDEHPLLRDDVLLAQNYFGKVEAKFFHLTSLLSVPFHERQGHAGLLKLLTSVDRVFFRVVPPSRFWAWMSVVRFSDPLPVAESRHGRRVREEAA